MNNDLLLESIRRECTAIKDHLATLEAESTRLQTRLAILGEAEEVLVGCKKPASPAPKKDAARAKGGNARASALSPARRSEIAKKAAMTRWGSKE